MHSNAITLLPKTPLVILPCVYIHNVYLDIPTCAIAFLGDPKSRKDWRKARTLHRAISQVDFFNFRFEKQPLQAYPEPLAEQSQLSYYIQHILFEYHVVALI